MARFALIAASTVGFFLTVALGNLLVPLLRSLTRRATEQPEQNAGAPLMGGLSYIVGMLAAVGIAWMWLYISLPDLWGSERNSINMLFSALSGMFLFGAIGFLDDCVRLYRRQSVGLRTAQRVVLEMAASLFIVLKMRATGCLPSVVALPLGGYADLGAGGYLLWMLLLPALAESMRLTDTSDGLCAGMAFVAMLGMMGALTLLNYFEIALLPAALAGALLGFLLWNFAPSKLLNGSVGVFFLAGALGCIPMAVGCPMLGVLLALPYLLQGGMVLLQVVYHRLSGGKRLFSTAPLHYWLSKKGWDAVSLCYAFCALELCTVLLALMFVRRS